MKTDSTPNYSWIDIIEPDLQYATYSAFDYIIALVLFVIAFWFAVKYFNVPTKIKFLFITYKLKKTSFSREYIKKILQLFSFEKDNQNSKIKIKEDNKEIINSQRHLLLDAYYAKDDINRDQIIKSLRILWKWL